MQTMNTCNKAPKGWRCTREADHVGPCATVKKLGFWSRLGNGALELLGQIMYQGPR